MATAGLAATASPQAVSPGARQANQFTALQSAGAGSCTGVLSGLPEGQVFALLVSAGVDQGWQKRAGRHFQWPLWPPGAGSISLSNF
jgi:hypothetical protein